MATAADPIEITPEQTRQYQEEGYMILERVIPEETLAMLREACHYFIGWKDGQLQERGVETDGITHKGSRYFIANAYRRSHRMPQFLFSDLMARIATAALGPNVYLFHEQWVVKGPEQGMKFSWHQDSGYVTHNDPGLAPTHKPYLTCWCALDDVKEENGTVYLLPHSRGGTRNTIHPHVQDPGSNDLVGYTGDDPGDLIEVPAGSIVCFSSFNLRRSGPNTTSAFRRVYLPQYSSEIIRSSQGKQWALAEPFVQDGRIVYGRD